MKFYDASKVYLALTLELVYHRLERMNHGYDNVPENATLNPTAFVSKTLSRAEWQYSNIEWEALGILHGLENFTTPVSPRKYI